MLITLTGFIGNAPIHAIKALRGAANLSLREAKLDTYDRVAVGEPVDVNVDPAALAELRATGWEFTEADPVEAAIARLSAAARALGNAKREFSAALAAFGDLTGYES